MSAENVIRRFAFQRADVRGEWVRVTSEFIALCGSQAYPPAVRDQLGEFTAACLLLASTLKFSGKFSLQVRSQGPVSLLMVECSNQKAIRGLARFSDVNAKQGMRELLPSGTLAATVSPERSEQYQSVVPMTGACLADSLEHYFMQSDQLATRLKLHADEHGATGFLVQQMPPQHQMDKADRDEVWRYVDVMTETLQPNELSQLSAAGVLSRLYVEQDVTLYAPELVKFRCSCSAQRMAGALIGLGADQLRDLLAETPVIDLSCEFCDQNYSFDEATLLDVAKAGNPSH